MTFSPFKPVKLGGTLAIATVIAGAAAPLPPGGLWDGARTIAGFAAVGLGTKVVCETLVEDSKAAETAQESEVQAAVTTDLYRARAAYYREYPHHWRAKKPVPDEWLELWGQTGGKPYLALHPLPPAQTQPIAPPASAAQPVQTPGQTRGGSFDVDAGFVPQHPSAPPPPPQTMPTSHNSFSLKAEPDDAWLDRLIAPSVLLVFGGDGSGKTSMALELLRRRQRAGHQTIALDPHANPNKWPGCEVVGGGLDFYKIEAAIDSLMQIRKHRYQQIRTGEVAPCGFPPITFVMEEMTDWKASVSNVDLLINKAGDYRKANIHLLMVSHGDTMGQIGAPDGSNEIIKNCFTKLRLFSKPGADGRPIPAMKGEVQYPLQQWESVQVPRFAPQAIETQPQTPETFAVTESGTESHDCFIVPETPETPPKHHQLAPAPATETRNADEPPKGEECRSLFFRLKDIGLNQTQIIKAIWGATPGESAAYKMARDLYKRLNLEYQQETGHTAA
jgi:hypothetical protein